MQVSALSTGYGAQPLEFTLTANGRPVDVRQMHDPDYVASLRLTSRQASALIDAIKGITAGLMARTA